MQKKAEIDIDLGSIAIIGIFGSLLILIVGVVFVDGVSDWWDGVVNDPNRETSFYDVTCEFMLQNNILFDVGFLDKFDGKPTMSCYYVKSSATFPFSLFWPEDKGNLEMKAQGKSVWMRYAIDEGSSKEFIMTLKKLEKGETNIDIIAYDDAGKPLDSRSVYMNIGE